MESPIRPWGIELPHGHKTQNPKNKSNMSEQIEKDKIEKDKIAQKIEKDKIAQKQPSI